MVRSVAFANRPPRLHRQDHLHEQPASMPPNLSTASRRWSRPPSRPAPTPPTRSPCAAARPASRCGSARSRATEASESDDISLRVFVGKRVASVSATAASDPTSSPSARSRWRRSRRKIPYQGLADPARLASTIRDLDLFDPTEVPAERLKRGRACRRRGGTCRQGRHQFRRQRRQRRARRAGARHIARLPRPVSRLALFASRPA